MNRASGVLMHISSLWGDYSEGSFGLAAKEWIDFLEECGFTYWQVLPFCLPDSVNSPYQSFGAFSGNPFFVDLPLLHEAGLITDWELRDARQFNPYVCEFDRLKSERMELLSKAAGRFNGYDEVDKFMETHVETANFCKFMALKKANDNLPWTEWSINIPDDNELKLWRFTQYMFFKQWAEIKAYANEKNIKIIGDIPIYVAWDSSDVWSNPDYFLLDKKGNPEAVAGVPPDYFCEDGQLWGNPLYNWKKMKADGYSWWKKRMEFMTELFDGVRIDHFRGFEAYYSIPAGETTARNGKWVKGPGISLVNALKSVCEDKLIIAEDLGDITPEVEKLLKDSKLPGMKIFLFGFLDGKDSSYLPHHYPENCIAYTGTHDNDTMLGFLWSLGYETRRRLFDYVGYYGDNIDESYDYVLRSLFASPSNLVIIPVQDVLLYGSDTRMNKPGEPDGNWEYRVKREQLDGVNKDKFKFWHKVYFRNVPEEIKADEENAEELE